ncbi:MAG: signal transduction histidine kinase, partial [Kiritimatiellia bacterium]
PSVLLVEVGVDGQSMPLADLHLPRSDSHLRLRFVSPSFKAQRLVRFRMRLDDRPYSDPSDIAQFGFTQMGPGEHTISVSATLDGESWSEVPAVVHVTVPRHWVGRWETWLAIVGGAAALVFGALVVRQRAHLGLETLRTRIALDLHDEVGAGLASVGLLGGLLRDDLPSDVHDQLVDRIVGTSKDLGGALRAIVWSLQPSSLNMGSLGVYLEDRARGVFGDFDLQHTLFISRPPDDASTRLGLDVLRAVQLVTLEALHNAARHARATQVELRLESCGRDRWRVVVQDNGVGVRPRQTSTVDSGNGLESMARRAREIGGELVVGPGVHGGTRVQLEFSPTARRRRRA